MNRIPAYLIMVLLLFTGSACSAKKPPEQSAVQGNKAIAALQDLGKNYEMKNISAFMAHIANTYADRQPFAASLEAVFAKYETVRFTFQYTRMLITVEVNGTTKLAFNWDSEWQTAGGSVQKNSGRSTFAFEPREAQLVSIDGKNPFIPQAAETKVK